MKTNLFLGILTIFFLSLSSCKKEDGSQNDDLIGKWSYPAADFDGSYTGYWTFNNDETLLISDRNDVFDGATTAYNYDGDSKKLTIGGIVVYQLIWISSSQFKYEGNGSSIEETTFTKVQ